VADSGTGSPSFDAIDVALLRLRYMAAFERYRAHAANLVEQTAGRAPLAEHLDEEQKALQDLAAVRAALLDALAAIAPEIGSSLLAETRDEMIRRSIAKRNDGGVTPPTYRLRLIRPHRSA
jgi:hypothetical protein